MLAIFIGYYCCYPLVLSGLICAGILFFGSGFAFSHIPSVKLSRIYQKLYSGFNIKNKQDYQNFLCDDPLPFIETKPYDLFYNKLVNDKEFLFTNVEFCEHSGKRIVSRNHLRQIFIPHKSMDATIIVGDFFLRYGFKSEGFNASPNKSYRFGNVYPNLLKCWDSEIIDDVVYSLRDIFAYLYDLQSTDFVIQFNKNSIGLSYLSEIGVRTYWDYEKYIYAHYFGLNLAHYIAPIFAKLENAFVMPTVKGNSHEPVSLPDSALTIVDSDDKITADDKNTASESISPAESVADKIVEPSLVEPVENAGLLPNEMDFSQFDPKNKINQLKKKIVNQVFIHKWFVFVISFAWLVILLYQRVILRVTPNDFYKHLAWAGIFMIPVVVCWFFHMYFFYVEKSTSKSTFIDSSLNIPSRDYGVPKDVEEAINGQISSAYQYYLFGNYNAFDFHWKKHENQWIYGVILPLEGFVYDEITIKINRSRGVNFKGMLLIDIPNCIKESKYLPDYFVNKYKIITTNDDVFAGLNVSEFIKLVENIPAITGDRVDVVLKFYGCLLMVLLPNENGPVSKIWNTRKYFEEQIKNWSVQSKLCDWIPQLKLLK